MGLIVSGDVSADAAAGVKRSYAICTRCLMNTSDPDIVFNDAGVCNHCRRAEALLAARLPLYREGEYRLERMVPIIKRAGRGRPYDCIIGVSGGVDSTYAALAAKRAGLRLLAVHFDNGWNSELAVANIETVLRRLGIELYTFVVDWEEFRDLQLSFLKASVPDAEIPTDHAIWALLYRIAPKFGARYVISGTNLSTESILPKAWTHSVTDWKYIRSVHERYGTVPLKTFPHAGTGAFLYALLVRRVKTFSILNSIRYEKQQALTELERELGYRPYGDKHHESIYTRFLQSYILPRKFGIDKRRAHLSALIVSGQITRAAALEAMAQPYADQRQVAEDKAYVLKKLALTEADFDAIMARPPRTYRDFRTSTLMHERLRRGRDWAQRWRLIPQQIGL